ncbi:MAG TPA: hypothetical protein VIY48_03900 [Candidatus Paceibacterota bacterium]
MATKTAKARNPERRSGKAWGKDHNVVKAKPAPSPEKVARRKAKAPVGQGKMDHAPVTMPKISWEWAARVMSSRWPNTRKVRSADAYFAWEKAEPARKDDVVVPVIEINPEIKSGSKPSKKSTARAEAAARRDGR